MTAPDQMYDEPNCFMIEVKADMTRDDVVEKINDVVCTL